MKKPFWYGMGICFLFVLAVALLYSCGIPGN